MAIPISDADIPVISSELPLSEAERRESLRQLTMGHWIARADLGLSLIHI